MREWITAATVGDLMLAAARDDGDTEAIVFSEERRTWAELAAEAVELARGLRGLGVGHGSHVGVLMPNTVDTVRTFFAVLLAGGVVVPLNTRYRRRELAYVVENADLEVLVTSDVIDEHVDFVELLHDSLPGLADSADPYGLAVDTAPRLRSVVLLGERRAPGTVSPDGVAEAAATVPAGRILDDRHLVRVRDPAVVPYTSGTTAEPKGCIVTHEALARDWLGVSGRLHVGAGDRIWAPCPMFHMAGIGPMVATAARRATMVSSLRFDPAEALDLIERERVTHFYAAFPTIMMPLLTHPSYRPERLGMVRAMMNVAPAETLQRMQSLAPHVAATSAFGMTEGGSTVSQHDVDDPVELRTSTSGPPLDGVELRIVDPGTLDVLGVGEEGEIQFRGFNTFEGYHRDPEKTAATIVDGGWVRSGDLGRLDGHGNVTYVGRIKDMLKVGGENVAPAEIEAHLSTHPDVLLAQVVGIPDEKYGEVPVAFVQLRDGGTAGADDLVGFCRGQIASFKVPRQVRFVEEWPMSATKIQKFRLREALLAEMGASV